MTKKQWEEICKVYQYFYAPMNKDEDHKLMFFLLHFQLFHHSFDIQHHAPNVPLF